MPALAAVAASPRLAALASSVVTSPDAAELVAAIDLGHQQRDRNDMAPTIAYFEGLLAQHPGHPGLTYEVAGAYDTAGQEAEARTRYEEALRLGLSGERLRGCLCQYSSTLRWLGEFTASLKVLDDAIEQFPDSDSVRIFRALTLSEIARPDDAITEFLTVITNHPDGTDLGRYTDGLAGLAARYRVGHPADTRRPAPPGLVRETSHSRAGETVRCVARFVRPGTVRPG